MHLSAKELLITSVKYCAVQSHHIKLCMCVTYLEWYS